MIYNNYVITSLFVLIKYFYYPKYSVGESVSPAIRRYAVPSKKSFLVKKKNDGREKEKK